LLPLALAGHNMLLNVQSPTALAALCVTIVVAVVCIIPHRSTNCYTTWQTAVNH
jgi:hypothetical protein